MTEMIAGLISIAALMGLGLLGTFLAVLLMKWASK